MWIYNQFTGKMCHGEELAGYGYSGHGDGVNNPAAQSRPDVGPIPQGRYKIGSFFADPEKGPIVAHLVPVPPTDTFGRSGFMIHGDNRAGNHSASLGCIVLAHEIRQMIAASGDSDLTVMAG